MADDHDVELADAAPAERARDEALARIEPGPSGAGGVDERAPRARSVRELDQRRRTLPDIEHRHALEFARRETGILAPDEEAGADRRGEGACHPRAWIGQRGPGREPRDDQPENPGGGRRHGEGVHGQRVRHGFEKRRARLRGPRGRRRRRRRHDDEDRRQERAHRGDARDRDHHQVREGRRDRDDVERGGGREQARAHGQRGRQARDRGVSGQAPRPRREPHQRRHEQEERGGGPEAQAERQPEGLVRIHERRHERGQSERAPPVQPASERARDGGQGREARRAHDRHAEARDAREHPARHHRHHRGRHAAGAQRASGRGDGERDERDVEARDRQHVNGAGDAHVPRGPGIDLVLLAERERAGQRGARGPASGDAFDAKRHALAQRAQRSRQRQGLEEPRAGHAA